MARKITNNRKIINTAAAWGIGLLIFFPILWTILTSFKTEATAIADPPVFLFFDWTMENYSVVQERSNYGRFLWNLDLYRGRLDHSGYHCRDTGCLVDGFCALQKNQGYSFVDAVNQDAACSWSAISNLSAVHQVRIARQCSGPDHCIDVDQFADHSVDALHIFPRDPR